MIRKIINIVKTVVLSFILWTLSSTSIENIQIRIEINDFISRGVLNETMSNDYNKFYSVKPKKGEEDLGSFTMYNDILYPGVDGDIIVGLQSAIRNEPLLEYPITFFFGGHSALSCLEYQDYSNNFSSTDCIEATGMSIREVDGIGCYDKIYWDDKDYRRSYIGLRVKASEQQKKIALNEAISLLGDYYNGTFIFDIKKSSYCTDLISKSYHKAGITLNHDSLGTTVQDLIVSSNTYIFLYKTIDINDVSHYYYLTD